MKKRAYNSPVRAASAADTRERILDGAVEVLAASKAVSEFTLDAVAAASGVVRLTVYKQFGSRRALLEAAFDRLAEERGSLPEVGGAQVDAAREFLASLVAALCDMWASPAMARIHDAAAADPELQSAIGERHGRRRDLLDRMVREAFDGVKPKRRREAVDVLFALTGPHFYRSVSEGRSAKEVCRLVAETAQDALARLSLSPD